MKKWSWLTLLILVILVSTSLVITKVRAISLQVAHVINPVTGEVKNALKIPSTAVAVAPNLYYLGQAKDIDGKKVEGYAFAHRKEKGVKSTKPAKSKTSCYGYLARGAKWKTVEDYLVDPNNTRGLAPEFIRSNLASDISKWEGAAGENILGNEIAGEVDGADMMAPDGKNEVYFADIVDSNAIAVNIVWGYFSGPSLTRELLEWDQVYDDITYDWNASGEPGKMDFENIATHELGHSVGMDDVYQTSCNKVTMYGYADYGETKKRTLEPQDTTGVYNLYK